MAILYFEKGMDHYQRQEYAQAVDCFIHSIIEHNFNDALAWLGNCYEYGLGVPKDLSAAKDLYQSCYEHLGSSQKNGTMGIWIRQRMDQLKDVHVPDTISRFIEGIGNVKVIRRLQTSSEPQLRYNMDEVVVTVQKRLSLYYGLAFAQMHIPGIMSAWTCDGKNRFFDGYTIEAYFFTLKVLRGNTDSYATRLDGRYCTVYFPRNADLRYIYVQRTILKKVREILVRRGNEVLPVKLKEVADRLGVTFDKCEVVNTFGSFIAKNFGKGELIQFSVSALQFPEDSFETLCIHELTHNFVSGHGSDFYMKMRELGGDKIMEREYNLYYDFGWPYLIFC